MKVKNISGEFIKGVDSSDPAFGIEYEDIEGNVRYDGIVYNIGHGMRLKDARKIAKELLSEDDDVAVKWAKVVCYDEDGNLQDL